MAEIILVSTVRQAALGETDNAVLDEFVFFAGMAIGADPPCVPFEGHAPGLHRDDVCAHGTDTKRRGDPVDDVTRVHAPVEQ